MLPRDRNVRLPSLLSYCPVGWRHEVLRLLVVEDEPFIGLHLVMIAEELRFNVDGPAPDAASALRLAALNPPDIAIVDVNLTDGPTGPAIAAHLAATFGTAVLIVSANPEAVTQGEGGVAAILTKPLDERELISVLCMFSARCADAIRDSSVST
jgi:two-component system, response regulator PdtaR